MSTQDPDELHPPSTIADTPLPTTPLAVTDRADPPKDQPARCPCGCVTEVAVTLPYETFKDLAKRLGLHGSEVRQYLDFLCEHHNMGPKFDASRPGFYFSDPFDRKTPASSRRFPDGIPFPRPSGDGWYRSVMSARVENDLKSDAMNPSCIATEKQVSGVANPDALRAAVRAVPTVPAKPVRRG